MREPLSNRVERLEKEVAGLESHIKDLDALNNTLSRSILGMEIRLSGLEFSKTSIALNKIRVDVLLPSEEVEIIE
jgi:hypothetical protein